MNTYVEGRLQPGKPQKMEHEESLPQACAPYHIDGAFQPVFDDAGQVLSTDASIWLE